jgi:glycerophosphoryl diester phosphodiesterase
MRVLIAVALLFAGQRVLAQTSEPLAWFQAHRGGLDEVPENTLPALEHAWAIPGAVPEVDLRTTRDGVIVCLHDDTPARTTNAPPGWADKPLREISFEELRAWDAGTWFDARFAGARVPSLDEVFELMARDPAREIYLDLKDVELGRVVEAIAARGFEKRVIFVHGSPGYCRTLQRTFEGARTMTWLSGDPASIRRRYERLADAGFPGISQLQFHLQPREGAGTDADDVAYVFDDAFLREAAARTAAHGTALQVRPFVFTPASLRRLLELGIHWYVTDAPAAFYDVLRAAAASGPGDE